NRRLIVVPAAEADEKRQVVAYPDLGWSVEHRRVENIEGAAAPAWLREGLAAGS
ncbi:MAG: folate-binding protein, partial [Hyphomicrobiales bacterium]